jgi:hypothetical protein
MRTIRDGHPALNGTTIFLKTVKSPAIVSRLLQPAGNNKKLGDGGKAITKGKWKGMPMYQLTLEERKTCPATCEQWKNCYGNNMPFANRIDHRSPSFFGALEQEVKALASKHSSGFVIRLHVLGDFYSGAYVKFWEEQLSTHPSLRLFGYTHRLKGSAIGRAIERLNTAGAWIRWSDSGGLMSANTDQNGGVAEGITCPEQTGKTKSCMTCGLCWSTTKAIRFLVH